MKNWKPDMRPAMITDDIAFVGGRPVSVHCFIGEDGLILLDTGFPGMFEGIKENMEAIGLNIKDVKYIIHSHGHIDHYGCTGDILDVAPAKTCIGIQDKDIVTGDVDLSWAKELHLEPARTFTPDICFDDGDSLTLCGRTFRFVNAPGHTAGTYAIFTETRVDGKPLIAAMHGGVGMNSMEKKFLNAYGMPLSIRDGFRSSLHALKNEHVDIVLGNHPQQSFTQQKLDKLAQGDKNAFVDADEWNRFLDGCEKNLDDMLRKEAEEE